MVPPMRVQKMEAHSSVQGTQPVPQDNMPMFPTGMYTADQMMGYAGSTLSYGEPCSYGGGSSTAQHEIGPSQLDEPPPITQPIQDYGAVPHNRNAERLRSRAFGKRHRSPTGPARCRSLEPRDRFGPETGRVGSRSRRLQQRAQLLCGTDSVPHPQSARPSRPMLWYHVPTSPVYGIISLPHF
uniref:Uncharacterized protein n=1 Tax=Oryza nivara TaxID=4536 RepID=A0A0E0HDW5_ORYNI